MASDPFTTLNPSDSGFLNAFLAPNPSTPLNSRIGERQDNDGPPVDGPPVDGPPVDGPLIDEPLIDDESVLEETVLDDEDPALAAASGLTRGLSVGQLAHLTDDQLDAVLRAAPTPAGFLARMLRLADKD